MSLCIVTVDDPQLKVLFSKWGSPRQEVCFPEFNCISCLLIISSCMYIYTQDFHLRVHPDPLHLFLCAYGGSRSARVQVAHGSEWWPGSRLAASVSIWCWQFTQALFSTAAGRINTLLPFSEGSISWPQSKKCESIMYTKLETQL